MSNIEIIPFNGDKIKPQPSFQSLKEQAQSPYDLECVTKKGFKPGSEIHNLLDNESGREILREIGTAHENGHLSRCAFITSQSTQILAMAENTNSQKFDYKSVLLARNNKFNIPDEILQESHMRQHSHKTGFAPPPPRPGKR